MEIAIIACGVLLAVAKVPAILVERRMQSRVMSRKFPEGL